MRHLKLKMDHDEACHVRAQEAAKMQAIVSNVEVGLEQSVAAEGALLRDRKELHKQLSEANRHWNMTLHRSVQNIPNSMHRHCSWRWK